MFGGGTLSNIRGRVKTRRYHGRKRGKARVRQLKKAVVNIVEAAKDCKEATAVGGARYFENHKYHTIHGTDMYQIHCMDAADPLDTNTFETLCTDRDVSIKEVWWKGEVTNTKLDVPVKMEIFKASMTKYAQANGYTPTTVLPSAIHGFFDSKLLRTRKMKTIYLGAVNSTGTIYDRRPACRNLTMGFKFKKGRYVKFAGAQPVENDYDALPFIIIRSTRLDGAATPTGTPDTVFWFKYLIRFCDNEKSEAGFSKTTLK